MKKTTKETKTAPKVRTEQRVVFTLEYTPFVMGGSVWQPMSTEVAAQGPYPLGRGYQGWLVVAPNGQTFVAEAETGAFVGPSIDKVREDVTTGDPQLMVKQVEEARGQAARARRVQPDEFWRKLKVLA